MTEYAKILIHRDVLRDAEEAIQGLREYLCNDPRYADAFEPYGELHVLYDLIDPLPEPDINGVTPRITFVQLGNHGA